MAQSPPRLPGPSLVNQTGEPNTGSTNDRDAEWELLKPRRNQPRRPRLIVLSIISLVVFGGGRVR